MTSSGQQGPTTVLQHKYISQVGKEQGQGSTFNDAGILVLTLMDWLQAPLVQACSLQRQANLLDGGELLQYISLLK